ncbi:MAG: hypothetical protein HKM24_03500, partial [Gammaproteobacteria bacterium]|nr:hypothetical protein [Gammaproteobacteria bacterium]
STLLEQVSASCQLHFIKVFLRSLIERLQRAGQLQADTLRQQQSA